MMNTQVLVWGAGVCLGWITWVTLSIFHQRQDIALLDQKTDVLKEVRDILSDIKDSIKRVTNG